MTTIQLIAKSLKVSFCFIILLFGQNLYSQYTVVGPSSANVNETKDYTLSGSGPSYGKTQWYVSSGGTIVSSTTTSARVKWTQSGGRSVGVAIWYYPVDSSPEATPSKSVTVISNDPPTVYTLSNNGNSQVCSTEGSVRLADSQIGASYRLYRGSSTYGSAISGTNSALIFSGLTSGTYTVRATLNGQTRTMNGSVPIGAKVPEAITISASVTDINNICPGTKVTLGTNGSGPNWSGTDNNNTVTSVTLSAGQSKTISVSAKNSCNETKTATITLKASSAIGTVNISSGLNERCKGGGTTDFNASATNASNYSWSISPNNTAGTINSSGLVTWNANYVGTATITATASNSCAGSSKSGTRNVTVTSPPLAYTLTGPSNLCSGSNGALYLSDTQSGVSYQLYKNNAVSGASKSGTGNGISWSGVTSGTYKIVASNGLCAGVNMSNQLTIGSLTADTVTISASVADINNICPGTTVTLGTNGSGPTWSGSDNNNTVTSVTLSAGQSKTISVSATNNCNVTQTATITLKASSAIGTVNISSGLSERCKGGGTTDFNASATNASNYSWSISPNNTAGTINSSGLVTWNANYVGTATITATASNSCVGSSKSGTRNVTVTSPPLAYTLTGPSNLCSGINGTLNLSDTQSGVSYQLYKNNAVSGASKSGTGNGISWSGVTSGTYKIVASNGLCAGVDMSNQLTIGSISADTVTISASVSDINNICPGTIVTLGTNGSGPIWSGSDNNNTVTSVTLSAGQSKTISVSAKNNCNVTQTATITLKASSAIGTVNISSGLSERCKGGGTTDFNASATNASNYSWSISPNNTAGTINSSGLVTWNANYVGTATITATASNSCVGSSKSGTRNVTVTSPPLAYTLTGPSNLCSGINGTLNLSDTQSGVSYQLYKNNAVSGASKSGTGNGISWSGITSGTYKIVASNGLCAGVDMSNEVTIGTSLAESVEINIGVSDDSIICANQQIPLSVPSTLDIISWENVDGFITGDNPAYVNLSEGSSRTVSVNFNNACGDFETVSVVLRTSEPVGNVTIDSPIYSRCAGAGSNTFTANAVNAASYSWSLTNGAGTISNNGIVEWEPSFYGEAYVTVIANNGCNNTSTTRVRINNIEEKSYFLDFDKDGFSTGDAILACSNPDPNLYRSEEFIIGSGDCDDEDEYVNPNTVWFLDEDGDGHALAESSFIGCIPPVLNSYTYESISEDDCNDKNNLVLGTFTWFLDADNDNAPANNERLVQCESPGIGYRNTPISLNAPIDCNDNDQTIVAGLWYQDVDQDGLGDPDGRVIEQCSQPNVSGGPWVSNKSDFCPDVQDDTNLCGANLTPNAGINYVYTRNYQLLRKINTDFFTEDDGLVQSITYFDGIGRAVQQVGIDQSLVNSGVKNDVVTYMKYDDFGRMQKEWLPYVTDQGAIGSLRSNNETAILDFYNTEKYEFTANPYSEKLFDNTPFNRIEKQGAPGNDWQVQEFGDDHSIEFDYLSNASNEVRKFEILLSPTPSLTLAEGAENEFYTVDELVKNIIYDENHIAGKNNSTVEFKDRSGRVLLKRTYADIPALDLNNDGDMLDLGEQAQNEAPHDTYYVYDDFSNLTYVLPPKMEAGVASLNQIVSNLNDLGYQYIYDNRNRLIEKKIPGKGWEYIIYNKLDQPIMTQDANQKIKGEWLFTKYDAFGRIAYSGKAVDSRERGVIQNEVNSLTTNLWVEKSTIQNFGGSALNYNNGAYPIGTLTEVLIVNYYDDYDFDNGVPGLTANSFGVTSTTRTQGLSTGSKIKVLDTDDWITNLTYYNEKGQPIYSYSKNDFLETTDFVTTLLDFTGKPLKVRSVHIRNGATIVTLDNFTYDALGRLLSQTQCIGDQNLGNTCPTSTNGTILVDAILDTPTVTEDVVASNSITVVPGTNGSTTISGNVRLYIDPNANGSGSDVELIVYNSYDELGKLQAKKVGGILGSDYNTTPGLQTIDYTYNIRNWLKTINDDSYDDNDLFNFSLKYNDPTNATALFNGNISQTNWNTLNDDTSLKTYSYSYDALNRITFAVSDTNDRYGLGQVEYDKNGNIFNLQRQGHIVSMPNGNNPADFDTMDALSYTYDQGNKLMAVTDGVTIGEGGEFGFRDNNKIGDDFTYDANGNLISDANKNITEISYNHLNLPKSLTVNGSNNGNDGTVSYIYDATGVKLSKIATGGSSTSTEYAGNYIYEGAIDNTKLQFFSTTDGYIEPKNLDDLSLGYDYIYQYKDHLGNIRLSYKNVGNTSNFNIEIQEENNYYPFGLKHKGYNGMQSATRNHKYGFGGKEEQNDLSLSWLDFGARNYDASLGRWMNVDPLSERYSNITPYSYVASTPIIAIDPDGKAIIFIGGLRVKQGATDQQLGRATHDLLGNKGGIYREDVFDYWSTKSNSFGNEVSTDEIFKRTFANDKNYFYTSGSSSYTSSAKRRESEGAKRADYFHKYMGYGGGFNKLAKGELIRVVSHSQGGAHAAGFVSQLLTYKDETGGNLYNVELIVYLNPHQSGDIHHPDGIQGIAYSVKTDQIAGDGLMSFLGLNGGSSVEPVEGADNYHSNGIFTDGNGTWLDKRGGHNVNDNVKNIAKVVNDFCRKNPSKCSETKLIKKD